LLTNKVRTDAGVSTLFSQKLRQIGQNKEHLVQLADLIAEYDPKKGLQLDRVVQQASTTSTKKARKRIEEILSPSDSLNRNSNSVKRKGFN
jgi:hypothetical protein